MNIRLYLHITTYMVAPVYILNYIVLSYMAILQSSSIFIGEHNTIISSTTCKGISCIYHILYYKYDLQDHANLVDGCSITPLQSTCYLQLVTVSNFGFLCNDMHYSFI